MQAGTKATSADPHRVGRRNDVVERAIFWLFVAGLAWVPFWYGGYDWITWGVNALIFPGLAVLYELWLLASGKRHPVGARNLALPALLFAGAVGWIIAQTLTWQQLPLANPIWGMAADALARPVAESISVNRDLTNLALTRLLTAASAFWLALQLCRSGTRAMHLLASIGAIGCAYAAYGLIALKAGHLPWLDALPSSNTYVSATFRNRDSYAAYAGIGSLVMIGFVLQRYSDAMRDAEGSPRLILASVVENTGGSSAVLLAGAFLTLVALLLTGSRGGLFAIGFGLFVLFILGGRREGERSQPRFALLIVALVVLATILLVFGGPVGDKLGEAGIYDRGRMAVYDLVLRSIMNAPLQGFGYGTFIDVFPMYRDRSIEVLGTWAQADNTYLEIFQGLGLVFGSLLIGCVVILVIRCARGALRRRQDAIVPRVAASAAILVGVNSLVGYGLQMQAVAITLMAILGAGIAQSQSSRLALED
jgi:O-antigen ligase/polysaccharide polymerase Wzy-like membrane protein